MKVMSSFNIKRPQTCSIKRKDAEITKQLKTCINLGSYNRNVFTEREEAALIMQII